MGRKLVLLLGIFICATLAYGQRRPAITTGNKVVRQGQDTTTTKYKRILGDTVKATYGAQTTRYTYEKHIKRNELQFFHPDTIPDNLHRYTDLSKNENFVQNLGNLGTALKPFFFSPKKVIGRTVGFHAYDAFYKGPESIRYFDTRSPFTEIKAIFGGVGRATTDVTFSVNDSTQLNLGFGYHTIRANKQLAYLSRGDWHVENTNWNIFGYVRPKKLPNYQVLFNMTQMKHTVDESGGILPLEFDSDSTSSLFDYRDANVVLNEAESYDKRGGVHIYQQYQLDSAFQLYHAMTLTDQILRYNDIYNLTSTDSLVYQRLADDPDTISDRTAFKDFNNEIGLKGKTSRFAYSAFYRIRNLTYDNVLLSGERKDTEHYLGGTLRQQITKKIFLSAEGEYLLGGNYRLSGDFSSNFFEANFTRVQSKPAYLTEFYAGQQASWTNAFKDEVSDNVYGMLKVRFKNIHFRPFLRFNRLGNHIYYDENAMPAQASNDVIILSPGFYLDWQLSERWKWSNTLVYTNVSGDNASVYRVPELMANSQLAYRNVLFAGKMIIHTGVDVHWRTHYKPYGYNPVIQQYHLQDGFESDAFVRVDVFLNFRVRNFIFFAQLQHFNQGFTTDGYFISPYYTGVRRTFDMGVKWTFFD